MNTKTATDELESVTWMLCEKYPDRSEDEIASLVHDVYDRLSSRATVTTHLIPLTVNRCQKMLTRQRDSPDEGLEAVDPVPVAS